MLSRQVALGVDQARLVSGDDELDPVPGAQLGQQPGHGVHSLPLTPWQGLGVVALWTAGALLLGALALKSRDA